MSSGDEFLEQLPRFDAQMEETKVAAEKEGKVVRFVGSIDVAGQAGQGRPGSVRPGPPHRRPQGGATTSSASTPGGMEATPLIIQGARRRR